MATSSSAAASESVAPSTSESNGKSSATAPNAAITNGKAKPNRELLEKLKEEMRKLRKATTSEDTAPKSAPAKTLLTIPPLLLGENEFKLNSCNYLMSAADSSTATSSKETVDEGKIMLCESKDGQAVSSAIQLSMDLAESRANGKPKHKRRKLDDEESESGEASSSPSSASDSGSDDSSCSSDNE